MIGALAVLVGSAVVVVGLAPESPPPGLSIVSDSSCPAAEAVRAALLRLQPSSVATPVAISLRGGATFLNIDFHWPSQAETETRELSVGADCQTRAEQAALVVAAWLGEPMGERLTAPVFGPAQSRVDVPPIVAAKIVPRQRQTTVGVGVLASLGGGWVSGLRLDGARMSIDSGFGWGASVTATAPRQVPLDAGVSRWNVISLAPVIKGRRAGEWLALELEGGPLVSLAIGWGAGYDVNSTDTAVFWGLCGDLRLLARGRPFQPWIDLRGVAWPYPPRLRTDTTNGTNPTFVRLPSADIQISFGINVIIP